MCSGVIIFTTASENFYLMKQAILLFPLLFSGFGIQYSVSVPDLSASVPTINSETIQWLTWEQAMQKSNVEKKKFIVDVYTDWCGWCKRMDAATFRQPEIAKYVNENYYAIKFNAEYKEDIVFNGKTYKYVANGRRGYHELAAELLQGRLSYPTVVFLDETQKVIQPIPGYKDPTQFEQIITYFGRNEHLKTPWEAYQKTYQPLTKE